MLVRSTTGRGARGRSRVAVSMMWNLTPCAPAIPGHPNGWLPRPAGRIHCFHTRVSSDIGAHSLPPRPDPPRPAVPPQPNQDAGRLMKPLPQQPNAGAARPPILPGTEAWHRSSRCLDASLCCSATVQGQTGAQVGRCHAAHCRASSCPSPPIPRVNPPPWLSRAQQG
jgi:hypothetical protein